MPTSGGLAARTSAACFSGEFSLFFSPSKQNIQKKQHIPKESKRYEQVFSVIIPIETKLPNVSKGSEIETCIFEWNRLKCSARNSSQHWKMERLQWHVNVVEHHAVAVWRVKKSILTCFDILLASHLFKNTTPLSWLHNVSCARLWTWSRKRPLTCHHAYQDPCFAGNTTVNINRNYPPTRRYYMEITTFIYVPNILQSLIFSGWQGPDVFFNLGSWTFI